MLDELQQRTDFAFGNRSVHHKSFFDDVPAFSKPSKPDGPMDAKIESYGKISDALASLPAAQPAGVRVAEAAASAVGGAELHRLAHESFSFTGPGPVAAAAAANSDVQPLHQGVHTVRNLAWYGFGLDRCLATYTHWEGVDKIGEPVPRMLDKLKEYIAQGKRCKIFTARVWCRHDFNDEIAATDEYIAEWAVKHSNPDVQRWAQSVLAREVIAAWTLEHVGVALEATCQKDPWCLELWDDIARQVEPNKGTDILWEMTKRFKESLDDNEKLLAFKRFVHETLDAANVPLHEEQNAITGCRVGARLDEVLKTSDFTYPNEDGNYPYTAVGACVDAEETQTFTFWAKNDEDAVVQANASRDEADFDFQVTAIHKGHNALVQSFDLNGS